MLSGVRSRITYTNVAMTLALVFAMSGGAFAARHYIVNSIKQINPKVLKQLVGKDGAAGLPGAQGPAGANGKDGAQGLQGKEGKEGKEGPQGPEGPQGSPWTAGGALPSGQSESGVWSMSFTATTGGERGVSPASFTIPLKTGGIKAHIIGAKEELAGEPNEAPAIKSGECSGSSAEPLASAGNMCIFMRAGRNAACCSGTNILDPEAGAFEIAGRSGAIVTLVSEEAGAVIAFGTWSVTAS